MRIFSICFKVFGSCKSVFTSIVNLASVSKVTFFCQNKIDNNVKLKGVVVCISVLNNIINHHLINEQDRDYFDSTDVNNKVQWLKRKPVLEHPESFYITG